MFVVGLTGDVGAGKSTLVDVWRSLGANVIDADEIAKEQWRRQDVLKSAAARWGAGIVKEDGSADFAAIAGIAFADEAEYAYMNHLIHPGTRAEMGRRVANLRGWIVAEIPLLFEAGRHEWIDYVVYVTAPHERRVRRNTIRGWDEGEIGRRERFLKDSADKQTMSDLVLSNEGDMGSWTQTAERCGCLFLEMAAVCELVTYCGSRGEAERIASILLEKRLVACVNIVGADSLYRWQDEVCRAGEWSLACKTVTGRLREIRETIRANHSYDLPAVFVRDFEHSDAATLQWVADCCRG